MTRRVLYLAWAPFFSGAERALVMTLRALDRSRYEPAVIAGTDGELVKQVRALGIPCEVSQVTHLERSRPVASALAVARVVTAARRYGAAILHANDMYSYQPGAYAAKLLRLPIVTHLRFPEGAAAYRWLLRPRFSRALFISQAFLTTALEAAPDVFSEDASTVIYDAVDVPRLWTEEERASKRHELGLPAELPVVAMTGQVVEIKGIREFVEAADRLRDTGATFVVLGDDLQNNGAQRRAMEADVAARGLSTRFRFLGFRPDGPQLTQAFDIVAAPSHVEPFGLASLEAMAAERPVVASRVGGIPEVVQDGVTGLLVSPRDGGSLAHGLRRLLEQPALAKRFAVSGRERATRVFGVDAHRAALDAIYEQALSARPHAAGHVSVQAPTRPA